MLDEQGVESVNDLWLIIWDFLLATILVKETLRFWKIPTALSRNTMGQQTEGDFQPHYVLIAKPALQ